MHRAKILSTVMLLLLTSIILLPGCSKRDALSVNGYTIENNQRDNKATYPYVLRTDSSTWYLSGEDISLLGEEDYYAGLAEILNDLEQDFSDARDALTGYIQKEIPPVDIYTDFSGRAGISEVAGAYYNERSNFIKLFSGWDMAKESLLHEYVHYLTMHCSETPPSEGFWAEGIAEYISKIVCKNRMLRSINMGIPEETALFYKEHGAWDEKEECIDPKLFYIGTAQVIAQGQLVGKEYFSVSDVTITRTPQIQQNPSADKVSHIEAACIIAYLADTYSKEWVFTNWNTKTAEMDVTIGESFEEIYKNWVIWNTELYEKSGLR
ncbi:MAG: hypothetical protein VZR24_22200 [Butyrivibrio hungatei]|nr:hypothetical protein [Butyrivibrio hungatei]